MGKETKIGMTVIAVLLVIFGVVLYQRLTRNVDRTVPLVAETPPANALPRKQLKLTSDGQHPARYGTIETGTAGAEQPGDPSQPAADSLVASEDEPTRSDSPLEPQTALMPPVDDRYAGRLTAPQSADLPDEEPQPATAQEQQPPEETAPADSGEERASLEANAEPAALKTTGDAQLAPTPASATEFAPAPAGANPLRPSAPTSTPALQPKESDSLPSNPFKASSGSRGSINKTSATQTSSAEPELAPAEVEQPRTAEFEQTSIRDQAEPLQVAQAPSGVSSPRAEDLQFAPSNYRQTGRESNQEPQNHTPPANGQYTVQPNDNYWTVSEKVYGTGGYFKAIQQHNKAKHPHAEKLQVGDLVAVPPVSVLQQTYPSLCPKPRTRATVRPTALSASTRAAAGTRTYIVTEGDTLFDIARHELGKADRWAEIYDLNREAIGDDFDFIAPGTHLVLPGQREERDSVTRQPGLDLQR